MKKSSSKSVSNGGYMHTKESDDKNNLTLVIILICNHVEPTKVER